MIGSPPEAPARSRRLFPWLLDGPWERPLTYLLVGLGVVLALAAVRFGPDARLVAFAFAAAAYSFLPVLALAVLGLLRGRSGRVLVFSTLVFLWLAGLWLGASFEFHREQGRHLRWAEAIFRLRDPASREVARGFLLDWPVAFLTAGVFLGYGFGAWFLRRLGPRWCATLALLVVASVALAGGLVSSSAIAPNMRESYLEAARAPWALPELRGALSTTARLDLEAARRIRRRVEQPYWAPGPDPIFASLGGRYQGRSIVLVVLESHRASDVSGLGEGAFHHRDCSPKLTALAARGLRFDRYYNFGSMTATMLWGILTGLPGSWEYPTAALRSPEATRLGRLPDLKGLGYDLEGLCPAPAGFDNWDRLWGTVGGRSWIDATETAEFARDRWTSWGMPDDQLYVVAERRYRAALARGRPVFLMLLTVSNHVPYVLPPGYSEDHCGGMRFADKALGEFVARLEELPPVHRPLLMVTADHSSFDDLHFVEPLGRLGPEGTRVPGLLLTPDGFRAGERSLGPFGHEDLLDLLYLAVAPPAAAGPRFAERHRVRIAGGLSALAVSDTTYYVGRSRRGFLLDGPWRLTRVDRLPDQEEMEKASRIFAQDIRELWP